MRKARDLSSVSQIALMSVAALVVLGAASSARAETPVHGNFGLGIADTLGGPTGINGVFDAGPWHAEATLALSSTGAGENTQRFDLAGHGWFHLHSGASSDFSVGGGLSFARIDPPGDGNSSTVGIDLGFQIRAFVTSNVAVSATGGLQVLTGDGDGFLLGGQPVGAFSLTYFF
jgi:hypothetical protein